MVSGIENKRVPSWVASLSTRIRPLSGIVIKGKDHGVPSLGGAGTKLRRPSGDSDMHVPVRSDCPQEEWWRPGPIFPKKQATIFFCALRDFFNLDFGVGTRPETANPLTASWFADHTHRSKFRHLSALPVSPEIIAVMVCWT